MEKIRMFYGAEVNGDFDTLKVIKQYLEKENFDITIINGDFIITPFSQEEFEAYIKPKQEAQEAVINFANTKKDLINKIGEQYKITPDLIEEAIPKETYQSIRSDEIRDMELYALASNNQIPLESGIRGALIQYSKAREKIAKLQEEHKKHEEEYVKIAENNLEKKSYKEVKKIMSGIEYLILPGDYDGKCIENVLKEENLHKQVKNIKGIKIAGYGGAQTKINLVPEVFMKFKEGVVEHEGQPVLISEPLTYLMETEHDIAVTHELPTGAIPEIGSKGLGTYVANKKPALVLSSHRNEFHGVYPFFSNNKTLLVMPGKLGKMQDDDYSERHNNLRTFAEIELTKDKEGLSVDKVTIKSLTDKNEVKVLSVYDPKNLS